VSSEGQSARLAVPAFLWIALVFVLFHDKAYTIDDPFFLAQAEQVLAHPLDPSGFDIVWNTQVGRASEVSPSGPGMAYLLAPTAALGGAEWAAHATVFAFLALAAWAIAALSRQLGADREEARLAAGALVSIPVVLAMAGTAMPDVPAMAVGLVGMERTLAFRRERNATRGIAAALCFAAAILIRSHAVMLLPVAAVFLVGKELRPKDWKRALDLRRLWPIVVAVPIAVGFAWLTRDSQSGVMNFATSTEYLESRALPRPLTAFFCHFLLALPFALAWLLLHLRRLSVRIFVAVAVILALAIDTDRAWAAPFAALSAVALWDVVGSAWRSRDVDRIALALWIFAALPVVAYVHLPAKYLAISAPAAALLLLFEARSLSRRGRRILLLGWMVAGSALGLAILRADARLAAVGRVAADRLVAPQVAAGKTVWYAGSWGFQWYAESAGARPLLADPDGPQAGDYIVYSTYRSGALGERHYGQQVETVTDRGPGGRVMDRDALAGFYWEDFGYLPWSWGTGTVDQYELWRIAPSPVKDVEQRSPSKPR
jgi:4-amino-4-deoxy-L-arabinose transferase-like glycosyltransferase